MKKIFCCLSLLASVAVAEPQIEGTPSELRGYLNGIERTVELQASAEKKVSAGQAVLRLRVHTEHSQLSKALQENIRIRNLIKARCKAIGILQVRESKFSSTPSYCDYTFDDMVIPAGTAGDSDGAFNLASDIGTADYQYLIDSADGKKSVIWVWTGTQPCFLMLLFQNSSKQNPPAEPGSDDKYIYAMCLTPHDKAVPAAAQKVVLDHAPNH